MYVFVKRVVVFAFLILVVAFVLSYVCSGFNLRVAIARLDVFTLIASLVAVLGKVIGAMYPIYGIARASIVAPSLADYARGTARQVSEESLVSWLILLASIALAYVLALLLKNILALMLP